MEGLGADIMDKSKVLTDKNINFSLVDIRTVKIDKDLKGNERIKEYVRQVKNPHLYLCGKFTIRSNYRNNGLTLEDNLRKMIF